MTMDQILISAFQISNFYMNSDSLLYTLAGIVCLLCLINVILIIQMGNLRTRIRNFFKGSENISLEEELKSRFAAVEKVRGEQIRQADQIHEILDILETTYQKSAVYRYDAFDDVAGKRSFVLVLLDKYDSGFLINAIHASSGDCHTYLKEIHRGKTSLALSEEEREALKEARNQRNYLLEELGDIEELTMPGQMRFNMDAVKEAAVKEDQEIKMQDLIIEDQEAKKEPEEMEQLSLDAFLKMPAKETSEMKEASEDMATEEKKEEEEPEG